MTSDELRRQADTFVDLADLAGVIGRPRQAHTAVAAAAPKFPNAEDDFEDAV